MFDDDTLLKRISASAAHAATMLGKSAWGELREHFDDALTPLRKRLQQHVFGHMLAQITRARGPGTTLLEFLEANVADGATVAVSGHSKGGALSGAARRAARGKPHGGVSPRSAVHEPAVERTVALSRPLIPPFSVTRFTASGD